MWVTARASIAEAEQRWDEAVPGYERAETGWAAFPHPFEAAQAALGLARCAARAGNPDVSRAAAGRAHDRFAALGAVRALPETTALLG